MEFTRKVQNSGGPPCWKASFGKAKEEVSEVYKFVTMFGRQGWKLPSLVPSSVYQTCKKNSWLVLKHKNLYLFSEVPKLKNTARVLTCE